MQTIAIWLPFRSQLKMKIRQEQL